MPSIKIMKPDTRGTLTRSSSENLRTTIGIELRYPLDLTVTSNN